MKLTKEQLKQIIEEELNELTEVEPVSMRASDVKRAIEGILDSRTGSREDYTILSRDHHDMLGKILSWLKPLVQKEIVDDLHRPQ